MNKYEAVNASCLLVIDILEPDNISMLNELSVRNNGMRPSASPGNLMVHLFVGLNNIIAGGYFKQTLVPFADSTSSLGSNAMSTMSPHAPFARSASVEMFQVTMALIPIEIEVQLGSLAIFFSHIPATIIFSFIESGA